MWSILLKTIRASHCKKRVIVNLKFEGCSRMSTLRTFLYEGFSYMYMSSEVILVFIVRIPNFLFLLSLTFKYNFFCFSLLKESSGGEEIGSGGGKEYGKIGNAIFSGEDCHSWGLFKGNLFLRTTSFSFCKYLARAQEKHKYMCI